jgi:hypothetical protein
MNQCPACGRPLAVPNPAACPGCGCSLTKAGPEQPREDLRSRFVRLGREAGEGGATNRVTIFHRAGAEGFEANAGSASWCGGELADPRQGPLDADGVPMIHLLSLDTAEAPALAEAFRGARSVSIFAGVDELNGLALDQVPPPFANQVPHVLKGAVPIAALSLDVPVGCFQGNHANRASKDLAQLLFNSQAFAGGAPLWVQEAEPQPGTWLGQITIDLSNEALGYPDGFLFVYTGGCVYQR